METETRKSIFAFQYLMTLLKAKRSQQLHTKEAQGRFDSMLLQDIEIQDPKKMNNGEFSVGVSKVNIFLLI